MLVQNKMNTFGDYAVFFWQYNFVHQSIEELAASASQMILVFMWAAMKMKTKKLNSPSRLRTIELVQTEMIFGFNYFIIL